MSYISPRLSLPPGVTPEVEDIVTQLQRELDIIADTFKGLAYLQLKEVHVAPTRPRKGMVVLADGTDWNPGSGAGYYGYYGAAWVKLG